MADPLAALRTELVLQGQPMAQQPEQDVLEAALAMEGGHVGRAAQAISDAHAAEGHARSEPSPDASALRVSPAPGPSGWDSPWLAGVWRMATTPFSLLHAVVMACLRALGLLAPRPPGGASGRFEMQRLDEDPRACARAFIAELEKDTFGTVGEPDAGQTKLPPFLAGSYADALRAAKAEIRILAVVLTSAAHSDDAYFKQHVLTDPGLVRTLRSSDFYVWGGDVRHREAYQVATLLQASTYPFVAFIALQPRRSRSRGTVVPHPGVLSRIEGSPHTALSAHSIQTHVEEVLLPRTASYLGQLRSERHRVQTERDLKAEQDRAYEDASRRDQERVLARRAEEEQRAEDARVRHAWEQERTSQLAKAHAWRQWARHSLVPQEAPAGSPSIRIAVHLPNGRNLQRRFAPTATLEQVYAFVDTAGVEDTVAPASPPQGYTHTYSFHLVQTYPRRVLDTRALATTLDAVEGLGSSASLVVEGSSEGNEPSDSSDDE